MVAFNDPTPVTISGASTSGVDVNVGGPQACPAVNAQALGIADLAATRITATDTGAQVHRGDTKKVIVFGPALSGSTNVSISGQPNDIIITATPMSVTATDGTPGVQFDITVTTTAAFGARSVVLRNANGDTTVFTAGLEVVRP
jgi:hypothetical protein